MRKIFDINEHMKVIYGDVGEISVFINNIEKFSVHPMYSFTPYSMGNFDVFDCVKVLISLLSSTDTDAYNAAKTVLHSLCRCVVDIDIHDTVETAIKAINK